MNMEFPIFFPRWTEAETGKGEKANNPQEKGDRKKRETGNKNDREKKKKGEQRNEKKTREKLWEKKVVGSASIWEVPRYLTDIIWQPGKRRRIYAPVRVNLRVRVRVRVRLYLRECMRVECGCENLQR